VQGLAKVTFRSRESWLEGMKTAKKRLQPQLKSLECMTPVGLSIRCGRAAGEGQAQPRLMGSKQRRYGSLRGKADPDACNDQVNHLLSPKGRWSPR
jgi:hypothetical protein